MFRLRPRARPEAPEAGRHAGDWYGSVHIGAETIGAYATDPDVLDRAYALLDRLEEDEYLAYVHGFVAEGRRRAGARWRYADIVTALAAATQLLEPRSYLEIGVRRGRSLATVAAAAPSDCALVGLDLWLSDYAGMTNPGPDFVRAEIAKTGFGGTVELLTGDSHEVLPRLFAERPELDFELVTVDGDHSPAGAERDLRDALPRLRVGGALVFDDIRHPAHPALYSVWRSVVCGDRRYSTWEFADVGYGVAVAVRRW